MAEETDADSLIILTSVEKVKINMDRPEEEELREISVDQAKAYMEEGHFGKYNMYPKFRAAVEFLEKREGRSALITSFDKLDEALKGKNRYTDQIKVTRSEEPAALQKQDKNLHRHSESCECAWVFLYFNRQSE